ncbi:MAG: hypothetical protein ACOYMW_09500 [Candidatus Competibacteraceae bacterium]
MIARQKSLSHALCGEGFFPRVKFPVIAKVSNTALIVAFIRKT